MISLRYGFLCEYAATMDGKPTVVGIHDVYIVGNAQPGERLHLPKHWVHFRLEASGGVGPRHLAAARLVDADGKTIMENEWPFTLAERLGDGLGSYAVCNLHIDQEITIPDFGTYSWVILVDGVRLGELPFSVVMMKVKTEVT